MILGASSSANKGAAAMLQAVVDRLPERLGPCHFDVLTTYPEDDRREPPRVAGDTSVRIVTCRPWELVVPMLPLAILAASARALGGSGSGFCRTPALRALFESDLVLDLAGISFADGRGIPTLAYNVLMTGIPLLVGGRVVKCSQALGPFRGRSNRAAARFVLPRLSAIVARGGVTARHLGEIGLTNFEQGGDLAFAMDVDPGAREEADRRLREAGLTGPFTAVVPSEVLKRYAERAGLDYTRTMREFVARLNEEGETVLLIAHSTRPGGRRGRMNDLPLLHEVAQGLDPSRCVALSESLRPEVLRALVGRARILVTARFHAMISALCEGTPVLVTGWSHKYGEILRGFGLEEWAVPYEDLEPGSLHERYRALGERDSEVRASIRDHLPVARDEAMRTFEVIQRAMDRRSLVQ